MVYESTDTDNVSALFDKWEEMLIGDFTFFAGKPNIELISYKPDWCTQNFMIMIPQNKHWQNTIIQFYGERAKIVSRYAIKKEPDIFDKEKLEKAVAFLPEQYKLSMIDERLYQMCRSETWSSDLVSQFPSCEIYRNLGLGAVICKNGIIISGASSYSRYKEGIEIEVDTKEEYRRKGLAYVCAAKLILECLKQNLYPSWDAQNKGSVALAEKLGYHYSHTYTAIEIWDY